ncbi:hypothetical protein DVH24_001357 [Malus domestica]|uniref:Protein S-acyltransferase n=1 Tax=Malus domestica TaxID=3750 RepID=A0A498K600_MALDO|nr:hypothetical protein DVH24_001357 [Malus domestica]
MAWNAFKLCTALRALGYVMVLVVVAIVGVTYYAVVLVNYLPSILSGGVNFVIAFPLLILFHFLDDPKPTGLLALQGPGERLSDFLNYFRLRETLLLVMLLWSYFNVVLTDPGRVPPNWRPAIDEETGDEAPLVGSDQSTMFYTFLETTLVTLSLFKYFMAFFTEEEIPGTLGTVAASFITFVLNFAFALSVFGFMIMHLSLVASNTTTIEAYEKKATTKWQYDLGRKKNFEQVFGTDMWYWFIPAYSEEDLRRIPALQGIDYPTRPELNALQPL